jgi:NAD(P)-dependent dehydrogenase (short-subunit alcohol dehydrogenase family)
VMTVSARGAFLGVKYVLPGMLPHGCGTIVNTASAVTVVGFPDRAAYSASKRAIISLTRQVAVQWASAGIRCKCICLGTVDSPWVGWVLAESDAPDDCWAALVARQPMRRLAQPAEVAPAALNLASDDAAFVTGTELVINGGICAG